MRSVEGTGKNIEQAIENALFELKAAREDVDIKILNEGGFLKKAKVLVSISEDAVEKYEKKEKFKEELAKEENELEEKADEKTDEDFVENFMKQKIKMKKENKTDVVEETIGDIVEEVEEVEEIKSEVEELPKEEHKNFDKKMTGEEFLNGVLKSLGREGNISSTEDERFVRYSLTGEDLNDLIGHHGECMLALSHVMSLVCKSEDRKKVVLDVEHYREKRMDSLTELAKRTADKVSKTGRYYKFEPMDASERKIIHTALQEDDRVTTMSKGEEPHRYLIVFPREYDERN